MQEAARALSLASRLVNLANHIKTNQLDINEALDCCAGSHNLPPSGMELH
jgi:hypothetical protein